jgi:hypothetical protein
MAETRSGWVTHPVVATIVGILAAGITVALVETAGHALLGVGDPRSPAGITTQQYAAVLVAWLLGASTGAFVATRWNRGRSVVPGTIAATFILLGAIASFAAIRHPTWMIAASALLPVVGFLVARASSRRVP